MNCKEFDISWVILFLSSAQKHLVRLGFSPEAAKWLPPPLNVCTEYIDYFHRWYEDGHKSFCLKCFFVQVRKNKYTAVALHELHD